MRLPLALVSLAAAALAVSACALRPRYSELVQAGLRADDHVVLVFKDPATGQPIPDMPISITDGRERMNVKTDANGEVSLPVNAAFTKADPLVAVDLPRSVLRYEFGAPSAPVEKPSLLPVEEPSVPAATEVAPAPTPAAPPSGVDAGT